jgi:Transposase DDE domain
MSSMIAQLAHSLQSILTTGANQAARDSHFIRRQRKLTGASFVQGLVFSWLDDPEATLGDLAQTVATVGTPVSPQALDQRFGPAAADCLRRVLQQAVSQVVQVQPSALPLLRRFAGVYLLDSSLVELPAALAEVWPGCGGRSLQQGKAALKLQACWELTSAQLQGLTLHAGRQSETHGPLAVQPLPKGSLRLADLGYFNLKILRQYSDRGVYWLTRLQPRTSVWVQGQRIADLTRWLKNQGQRVDQDVTLGVEQLPCRLLAVRVPAAVAAKRRRRLLRKAQKKGRRPSAQQLALAAWNLYVSNVPQTLLTLEEALVVTRCRWQVEVLFKHWKSDGQVDEWNSSKPYRILCEVYAKLLALVLEHWILAVSGLQTPKQSVRRAARKVRQHALHLASVLADGEALIGVLSLLQRCIQGSPPINKRRSRPATFQLLDSPPEEHSPTQGLRQVA